MVLQVGIICENIIKILEGNFLKVYQNLDFLTQAFVYFSKIRALLVFILNLKGLR